MNIRHYIHKRNTRLLLVIAVLVGIVGLVYWLSPTRKTGYQYNSPRNIKGVYSYKQVFNDLNEVQLLSAQKYGISPNANIEALKKSERLQEIVSCEDFVVDSLTHSSPYLVPRAKNLLHDIGKNFLDSLSSKGLNPNKIIVTSVLRTVDHIKRLRTQNVNASQNSAHVYATTFDISWRRFQYLPQVEQMQMEPVSADTLKMVLAEVLNDLRTAGRCYVKHEAKQACFHITVR